MIIIFILICFISVLDASETFTNPILQNGADPWVLKHDGWYYYTQTTGDNIEIYKTQAMQDVANVDPVTVWTPPSDGLWSKNIWAPEIHFYDNKFYIYFAADDGNNNNHRMYCIENLSDNPMTLNWTLKGKVFDKKNDHWAIDGSILEFKDKLYMLWSGWKGDKNIAQNIYIAALSNPWTIKGNRILISTPEYPWEKGRITPLVNEAPEALMNSKGQLFVTYSASGCWTDEYALGLLSLKENGDPMNPNDWKKSNISVFSQNPDGKAFGPGHNGFFKSPDGKEDWIIYHANSEANQKCGNLRNVRMQKLTWNDNGTPNFGSPLPIDSSIEKPSEIKNV